MSHITILDEKRYPIHVKDIFNNNDLLDYYRFEHRGTIAYMNKRYMVVVDQLKGEVSINDITDNNVEKVKEDDIWITLFNWFTENEFLGVWLPLPKPVMLRR